MYGLLNIASLFLGLAAWLLPILVILRRKSLPGFSAASYALCCLSLLCQVLYTQHLVTIRDWSAVEDTHGAVVFCSLVLLAIAAMLNLVAFLLTRPKT